MYIEPNGIVLLVITVIKILMAFFNLNMILLFVQLSIIIHNPNYI